MQKINLKWIRDLNAKAQAITFLEQNTEENTSSLVLGNFLKNR